MLHIFVTLWTSKTFMNKRIYVSNGLPRLLSGRSEQHVNHVCFLLDLVFIPPTDDEALRAADLSVGFLSFQSH